VGNEEMNARITRGRVPQPPPAAEPEQERPDYGAGVRPMAPRRDAGEVFRRWLSQQYHRSRLESQTVNARRVR
jgi:hypothetical protein